MQDGNSMQFTSRSPGEMVHELNRNREMTPGHSSLQDILGRSGSGQPNIDKETGLPVAGKYLNNGQEQNAAPAPGALQEEEREEQPGLQRGQGGQGQGIG